MAGTPKAFHTQKEITFEVVEIIKSIRKVKVVEISKILPFTRDHVDPITHKHGVYLLLVGERIPADFKRRDYCKIGRVVGTEGGIRNRLLDNMKDHENHKTECGSLKDHSFQVLACENGTDAARLEAMFHLWHGRYPWSNQPIEPRGLPLIGEEPDFFEIVAEEEDTSQ
jgi:hypothetical protein